jgi:hypothetical protein
MDIERLSEFEAWKLVNDALQVCANKANTSERRCPCRMAVPAVLIEASV